MINIGEWVDVMEKLFLKPENGAHLDVEQLEDLKEESKKTFSADFRAIQDEEVRFQQRAIQRFTSLFQQAGLESGKIILPEIKSEKEFMVRVLRYFVIRKQRTCQLENIQKLSRNQGAFKRRRDIALVSK